MNEEKKITLHLSEERYTMPKSSVVFPDAEKMPKEKKPKILDMVYQEVKTS